MTESLRAELADVRDTLLAEPVSPRVERPADVNRHHCRYVAETVADRVGEEVDVQVLEDGGRGHAHIWLYAAGRHYDAECVEGVADHRDLPFFRRHPDAAIRIEPRTVDQATVRTRSQSGGFRDLYPPGYGPDEPAVDHGRYARFAVAGVALGVVLVLLGLGGEWALATHLVGASGRLGALFRELEIVGGVLAVVAPVAFLLLLPAQRARAG